MKYITKSLIYAFLIFLVIVPMLFMVIISFMESDGFGFVKKAFTLDNYKLLFNPLYKTVILNSLKMGLVATFFCFLLSYPLSFIVARSKYSNVLFVLLMIPYWTNSLVRTYAFLNILGTDGVINKFLMFLGIIDKPLKLLYNDTAVLMGMIYLMLPVMFLALYSGVVKIDYSLALASRDLGAGRIRTFFKVIVPQTYSQIVSGFVLVFAPTLGLFFVSDLLGGGKTVILGSLIRDRFTTLRDISGGSALSVIMMLISLIFITIYMVINKKGGERE